MPRIFLYPGYIRSKNDGDTHFISARQLARLYNVDNSKCIVIDHDSFPRWEEKEGDIHLYPKYSGNYTPIEGE